MQAAQSSGDRGSGRRHGLAVGLGVGGGIAVFAWLCTYTVGTGEFALVTEFGKPIQVVTTPGLRFKLPYHSVWALDARLFAYAPPSTEFLTLEEYQKAPEVTRARLYIDAMGRTLPKVKMYVIDSQNGRVPVNLRVSAP